MNDMRDTLWIQQTVQPIWEIFIKSILIFVCRSQQQSAISPLPTGTRRLVFLFLSLF